MSERCPQDGGFIGDAGCTHPNHRHSELVRGIVSGEPKTIRAEDAAAALEEGFYVSNPDGKRVGFGKRLLAHIESRESAKDADARKERLAFAVATVMRPDKVETGHKGLAGRTAYAKAFDGFGVLAVSDAEGGGIEAVFNIIPKRSLKGRARGSGKRFAATRRKQTAAPMEIIANPRVVAQGGVSA